MTKTTRIADLTVDQLQGLIKRTVQEAMTEVLLEFTIAAELDAELEERAEMTEFLRAFLGERPLGLPEPRGDVKVDD